MCRRGIWWWAPMAELGETSDPVALVPGAPNGVDDVATVFTTQSESLDAVGRELHAFDPLGWTGGAAGQFREFFAPVPTRWYKTSDALVAAAGALTGYAETLRWAQSQAREAIALWEEGEAATATALATHQTALSEADVANQPAPTFSDPGAELRQQARDTLDRARTQLDEAGCTAAQVITGHGPQGTDVSTFLTDVLVVVAPDAAGGGGGGSFGGDGWEVTGPRGTASLGDGPGIGLGSVSGDVNIYSLGEGENRVEIGAGADGSASLNGSGLHVSGEVTVGATADGQLTQDYGAIEFTHRGEALAGGRLEGGLDVGGNGVHAHGELFAGGRVEYEFGADVGGVGASGTAEGWAGAGVSGTADLGYENGRFTIDLEGGAAVGVGGKLGGEITIDPGQVAENIENEAEILRNNTDLNPGNDNHQDGFLNSMERGFSVVSGAVADVF